MAFEIKITPEMKRRFQSEVAEHLNNLEKMLMVLEKDSRNGETIHSAFRAVHSIKGNSDYVGIKDINRLSHKLEDLMDDVRSDRIVITDKALSLLFEGLDLLRDMNNRITEEDYQESDVSSILDRIGDVMAGTVGKVSPPPKQKDEVDVKAVFAKSCSQHIEYIRKVTGTILAGKSVKGAKKNVLRVLKTFRTAANYVGVRDMVALLKEMEAEVEGVGSLRKKMAGYLMDKLADIETLVNQIGKEAPVPREEWPDEADRPSEDLPTDILENEMKVGPEKLDEFMNQVAELTIAKNTLNYLTEKIVSRQVPEWGGELKRVTAKIHKLSGSLHSGVLKLRLVRINSLFERLPRIVRYLSLKAGKNIELSVLGGETEIDRKVIELLIDPLIHLIRNAVDHGIESPPERVKKGKPESGTITVKAHEEGNHAIIEIIDDGKGLHLNTIRKTALKKKIITENALSSMTDNEVINLIFVPGFSTAPKATSVSGRGVGLDVVKNNMKRIGGNVTLESEPDNGIRVRLQVPISIAVMDVLLTEAGGEQYAFPFSSVLESIPVKRGEIQVLNRRETIPYYGTVLALRYLKEILGVTTGERLRAKGSDEALSVIVITFGGQVRGIVVDRILRRDGILTRPLEEHLAGIKEFSGAALLRDGSIVLVLDPMGLWIDK